jgi:hypothetical protein
MRRSRRYIAICRSTVSRTVINRARRLAVKALGNEKERCSGRLPPDAGDRCDHPVGTGDDRHRLSHRIVEWMDMADGFPRPDLVREPAERSKSSG